ncbi:hypothetical protein M8J77_021796 [Diaphorina citri]|nr:hypothetical protein M8J77_021796 [Diaphorina citri]
MRPNGDDMHSRRSPCGKREGNLRLKLLGKKDLMRKKRTRKVRQNHRETIRGRRRISWWRNLREWFNCSSCDLFRAAVHKVRIAMIANLQDGEGT